MKEKKAEMGLNTQRDQNIMMRNEEFQRQKYR